MVIRTLNHWHMAQWNTFFSLQQTYLKFTTGVLEHRAMNSGLLPFRKTAGCYRCQTKMKRAGFVKHCFCTLHICGYVASMKSIFLAITPLTGSCAVVAEGTSPFYLSSTAHLGTFRFLELAPLHSASPKVTLFSILVCFLKLNTRGNRTETGQSYAVPPSFP